ARVGADVERLVQPVCLGVLLLGERVEALADPDVTGGAGAHPAAGVTHGRAALLGRVQDAGPLRDLDAHFVEGALEPNARHTASPRPPGGPREGSPPPGS